MDQQNDKLTDGLRAEPPTPYSAHGASEAHPGMLQQDRLTKKKYRHKILKRPILATLQKLMVAYLVVWSISPPLSIDMIYRYAALGCAGGWLVIEMSRRRKFERIHGLAIAFMLAVIAVALAESGGNFAHVLRQIALFMLVIGFLMNYVYRDRWDEFKYLVVIVLTLFIVFNIISAKEVINDPTLARKIVRNDTETYAYLRQGVGGDALLYSQVLIFPVVLAWTFSTLKRDLKLFILGTAWTASFLVFLLNAGYSIAIISVISSSAVLFFYKRRNALPAVLITLSIIVAIVVLIGYVDQVRNWLLEFFKGTKVAAKVKDIYDSIHGKDIADSIQSRIDRYWSSIETIFSYPLIGGLWWRSGGGHSAILDTFAKYGVWGGWIFCRMVFCTPNGLKRNSKNPRDMRISNAFFSSLSLVLLLDSLPYNLVFPIIILAPIMVHQIQKWADYEELEPVKKFRTKFLKKKQTAASSSKGKFK